MWHRRPWQGGDNGTSSPTVGRGIRKNKLGDRPPRLRCAPSCFTISSVMKIQINFSGEHQLICVKQQTVGQMWHIKPNGNNLSLRQGSQHGNATSLAPRHVDERQSRKPGAWGWYLLEPIFSVSLIKVAWPCLLSHRWDGKGPEFRLRHT